MGLKKILIWPCLFWYVFQTLFNVEYFAEDYDLKSLAQCLMDSDMMNYYFYTPDPRIDANET
jgi:hypothetical protein